MAMQEYGCYEGAFDIMQDNPALGLSLHSMLPVGVKVLIKDVAPKFTDNNLQILEDYEQSNVAVVGGTATELDEEGAPVLVAVPTYGIYEPFVEEDYWIPGYVQLNDTIKNYAISINLQLNNE